MTGASIKIENFVFDYFEYVNNSIDMNKVNHIYDILINCSYDSEYKTLEKKEDKLYFSNEQLKLIKEKQKELGYEGNFNKFVRYALFDFYMKEHNIIVHKKFIGELINYDKFKLLMNKCKDDLLFGKYTSYDLDLLRDNKKYEGKISFHSFNEFIEDEVIKLDFLELDMVAFLNEEFEKNERIYSELIGFSTEQILSQQFLETEEGNELEEFIDYDNIVPNIDSFYYLFLYHAFVTDPGKLDINEIFNETNEHIDLLLKKYTFEKILRHYKQKYNIINIHNIFDKECIENLLLDSIITSDDIVEEKDIIESGETIESDSIIESDEIEDTQ